MRKKNASGSYTEYRQPIEMNGTATKDVVPTALPYKKENGSYNLINESIEIKTDKVMCSANIEYQPDANVYYLKQEIVPQNRQK